MEGWFKKTNEEKLKALNDVNKVLPNIKTKELLETVIKNKDESAYNEIRMLILTTVDSWFDDKTKNSIEEILK